MSWNKSEIRQEEYTKNGNKSIKSANLEPHTFEVKSESCDIKKVYPFFLSNLASLFLWPLFLHSLHEHIIIDDRRLHGVVQATHLYQRIVATTWSTGEIYR